MSNTLVANASRSATNFARARGYVTADEVQNYLDRQGFRGSANERAALIRAVFRSPRFRALGEVPSTRPAAKSRYITLWTVGN